MDDHSAAGPDGMRIPHLKIFVRPRAGEMLEDSCFAALHNYLCLMDTEGVSKETANFHAWATLLACSKPNGNYRTIAIGTVARRIISFSLIKLALPGTRDYFGPHQITNGVPVGTEVAIHAFRDSIAQRGWDPGGVVSFIDARNVFSEFDHQMILDTVLIHASDWHAMSTRFTAAPHG